MSCVLEKADLEMSLLSTWSSARYYKCNTMLQQYVTQRSLLISLHPYCILWLHIYIILYQLLLCPIVHHIPFWCTEKW